MSLSKRTITDKIEILNNGEFPVIQVREANQVIETDSEEKITIHGENYFRYMLHPDADVSTISDPVVLAQFNAVMTDTVKSNYQTFLESQEPEVTEESSE